MQPAFSIWGARASRKETLKGSAMPDITASDGIRVHYDIFRSAGAYVPPRTRVWQQFKDEYDTQVQRMWRLEQPPQVALAELQTRVQSLIDQSADQQRRRYGAKGSA